MPTGTTRISFHVPIKNRKKAMEYLRELQASGKIIEARRGRGEGELMVVSAKKTKTIRILTFDITLRGDEEFAKKIVAKLFSREIVPSGREWMVYFNPTPI